MHPNDPIPKHFSRLQPVQKAALKRLKIETVRDLLYHFPTRYELLSEIRTVATLKKNDEAILYGRITGLETRRSWKTKKPVAEGWIEDGTGRMKIIWFHQPYIAKMLTEGAMVKLSGRVTGTQDKLYFANPEIEHTSDMPIDTHDTLFKQTTTKEESKNTSEHEETFLRCILKARASHRNGCDTQLNEYCNKTDLKRSRTRSRERS
jgi:ATP-dependent DNA helicase RecG